MALQAAYKQFLAAPNPSFLADNASLHYVTTLTSLHGSAAIIKFLGTQSHQLKKKEEKFLDVVESQNAIAAEVFTTIEFETSGSAYLPGLDDNFLADRVVTFPIIHIVQFNADGKIQQIRQNWDQGSLLKLIDVIGKTGRNWPIRDGKDQIKLITSSVTAGGKPVEGSQKQGMPVRSRENSNNVTRDPHASLSLFAPREQTSESSLPAVVAPRASAKPPPRDLNELFVGENGGAPATPARGRSTTSSSSNHSGDKRQHQQNYLPSRLFDNDENSPIRATEDTSKEPRYRPNPAKFKHFDFADPSDAPDAPEPRPNPTSKKSKHGSQWGFEDFQTPAKVVPTKVLVNRTNDVRHWGNSDDEVLDSPVKFKKVDKPRKDAQTHFEFQDDGNSKGEPRLIGRPRGSGQNNGMGLYQNNLYDEENGGSAKGAAPRATSGLANVKDRRKDFDPHFAMTDDSPSTKHVPAPLAEDRAKAVKMMDANWSSYDQSPLQKENFPASPTSPRPTTSNGKGPLSESTNTMSNKGINIAGDGMGSRKVASAAQSPPKQRGISIGGDGMGGKKGAGRSWGFGDDSDGEEAGGLNGVGGKFRNGRPGKAQHQQQSGGDFWDF